MKKKRGYKKAIFKRKRAVGRIRVRIRVRTRLVREFDGLTSNAPLVTGYLATTESALGSRLNDAKPPSPSVPNKFVFRPAVENVAVQ